MMVGPTPTESARRLGLDSVFKLPRCTSAGRRRPDSGRSRAPTEHSTHEELAMSDQTQSLESYEEGVSLNARKLRITASKIDTPKLDDRLLSPYREDSSD